MSISHKHLAENLASQATQVVCNDLITGKVELDAQESVTQNKQRCETKDNQNKQFYEVIKRRKQLEQQLKQVKYQQNVIKSHRTPPMNRKEGDKNNKYFRSTITEEQKNEIKKIIKSTKQMQQLNNSKIQVLQQTIKKQEQQLKQSRLELMKQKSQKKRKEILLNLDKIEERKNDRKKQLKLANQQYQRVSKLKFLHQKIQQKWKIDQKIQDKKYAQKLQKIKRQKSFSYQDILKHAKKYSQIIGTQKQRRFQNEQKLKNQLLQKLHSSRFTHSSFFKTIQIEENQKKLNEVQKIKQPQNLKSRITNYAESIRQKNKKDVKQKHSISQIDNLTKTKASKSLDNLALNKLGNSYMNHVHSCIASSSQPRQESSLQTNSKLPEIDTSRYINYLTQAKLKRQKNPQQYSQINRLKKILNKQEKKQIKLFKAQEIINKLDNQSSQSSKNLINTIMAKISLIQQIGNKV